MACNHDHIMLMAVGIDISLLQKLHRMTLNLKFYILNIVIAFKINDRGPLVTSVWANQKIVNSKNSFGIVNPANTEIQYKKI